MAGGNCNISSREARHAESAFLSMNSWHAQQHYCHMMKPPSPFLRPIALCLLILFPSIGSCLSAEGHEIVALIAQNHLTPRTRDEVTSLLAPQTMADVSSWADYIRRERRETSPWHYIDREITTGRILDKLANSPSILDAISSQTRVLLDSHDVKARQTALKLLIHFVADLHQPLHAADNFDEGGNKTIIYYENRDINLHKLWDAAILEQIMSARNETTSECAKRLDDLAAADADSITSGGPQDWAMESFLAARCTVYHFTRDAATSAPIRLPESYFAAARPLLEKQLAKAGYRLAYLLNMTFDPDFRQRHQFGAAVQGK